MELFHPYKWPTVTWEILKRFLQAQRPFSFDQERVEQLLKQLEKRLVQLKELEKMTLEEMWEPLGFTELVVLFLILFFGGFDYIPSRDFKRKII